jgi:hypothetical protein
MGYRGKVTEREQARELRALGWTLAAIARKLGVSKSSVSLWVRDVEFEPQPRARGAPRRRGPNVLQQRKQAEIEEMDRLGVVRLGVLGRQAFLAAGAALYAGEGNKTDGDFRFSNTDAALVGFFCRWLREFFDVDEARLRGRIYLHEGLDLDAATAYWSAVTGIPPEQFRKPYRAVADATRRTNRHEYGCVYVSYGCSRTHRAVMGLVRALVSWTPDPG